MGKSELEQKFLSLVDSYKQVIYKVCFMYATDDETISDLYQEVVLNLWTAFPRFRSESKPGAPDKPCGVGRADANPKLLLNDT